MRQLRPADGGWVHDQEGPPLSLLCLPDGAETWRKAMSGQARFWAKDRSGRGEGPLSDSCGGRRGSPTAEIAGRSRAWEALDRKQQQRILAAIVERIRYDRSQQEGSLRFRPEMARRSQGEEVPIRAGKKPLVQQIPPTRVEETPAPLVERRLPRITKLLALAVRLEDLLRQGTAKDYADLARLGSLSRARITQVMNLRNLAPAIQERILLHPPVSASQDEIHERALRRVTACLSWRQQMQMVAKIWPAAGDRK
jgi:hypothetical protein